MSKISALTVKELREKTGAGLLNCKKALEDNHFLWPMSSF